MNQNLRPLEMLIPKCRHSALQMQINHKLLPPTYNVRLLQCSYRISLLQTRNISIKAIKSCNDTRQKPFLGLRTLTTRASSNSTTTTPPPTPVEATTPPAYQPPKTGILSIVPASWVPYLELSRIDKPAGAYYLFFPCLFSTLLAAPVADPTAAPSAVLATSLLFFAGAVIMRGAGCTVNDLWDRNLDPHVARTRLRPIARGAVKPVQGLAWAGAQMLAGLGVLVQFPSACLWYGIPSLALVTTYPLAKRVTHYPQVVLGLAFSWGAMMGFPALGVELLGSGDAIVAAGALYASCVSWTVLYDMIYAHMDIKDDAKAGIKSIALRHEKETKAVLTGLGVVQVGLLGVAGAAVGAGPAFFAGSLGGAAVTLAIMIKKVDLKSVSSCLWWFTNGSVFTGGAISLGLLMEYLVHCTAV